MAQAIAEGTEDEGVTANVKRVDYTTATDFIYCDTVAFESPYYFSYMVGLMKNFFDRNLGIREKVTGKPAAAFTSRGALAI